MKAGDVWRNMALITVPGPTWMPCDNDDELYDQEDEIIYTQDFTVPGQVAEDMSEGEIDGRAQAKPVSFHSQQDTQDVHLQTAMTQPQPTWLIFPHPFVFGVFGDVESSLLILYPTFPPEAFGYRLFSQDAVRVMESEGGAERREAVPWRVLV
ncbi:hypothetical protein UPYG_G00295270 [Umbra pygmaea]|uniref:Uncharacterized protein n=1 Tax=Umbra pygmaea TaxID=75934 RepID=A0ABD0W5Y1_UMBPY